MSQPVDGGDNQSDLWTNWAGNLFSAPSEIASPSNAADVQKLILQNQGASVRAVGTGHSFSPLVVGNGQILVEPSKFTGGGPLAWRWQHKGLDLVSFVPAARWVDVRDALTSPGNPLPPMYLSTTGPLNTINATGFVAAGCHGTGWAQQTLSDLVYAVEFVDARGALHVFSEETTPDNMAAVRVNLGTLGIITKLTLHVEPMYNLRDEEVILPTENVMGPNPAKTDGEIKTANLLKLVTGNDYIELFWFPGSGFDGQIWLKKFNRTTEEERDIPLRPDGWVDQMADKVMGFTSTNPILWPLVLGETWSTIKDRAGAIQAKGGFVAKAPRVLFYVDRAFPVLDLEVSIPIPATGPGSWNLDNVVKAWYGAMNYTYAHQSDYPVTACIHARFTKSSQALLSPAYSSRPDDRVCWIEILSAYPKSEPDAGKRAAAMRPHLEMLNQVIPGWVHTMAGRPHWAKNWQYIQPGLNMRSLYPEANLAAFNTLRRTMDPGGMFLNPFLKKENLFT